MPESEPNYSELMDVVAHTTGAVVNFHDLAGITLEVPWFRLRNEQVYHHGTYCAFAKLHGNQPRCAQNKDRSKKRAAKGEPFFGICPYGVWDYAQPVTFRERVVGIVYVGSLHQGNALSPMAGKTYNGPALPQYTEERHEQCAYYARYLADHMVILLEQWQRAGHSLGKRKTTEHYVAATHAFIESHYTQNIGLQELATQLDVHPNYLGNIIQRQTQQSFRQLLLNYRIQRAQVLLRAATGTSITHIAYQVGFHDGNYFSTVFKKVVGRTPRQYRLAEMPESS